MKHIDYKKYFTEVTEERYKVPDDQENDSSFDIENDIEKHQQVRIALGMVDIEIHFDKNNEPNIMELSFQEEDHHEYLRFKIFERKALFKKDGHFQYPVTEIIDEKIKDYREK